MEKSNNSLQAAADTFSAGLADPLVVAEVPEREGPGVLAETARELLTLHDALALQVRDGWILRRISGAMARG
jgi:hypothetical protein